MPRITPILDAVNLDRERWIIGIGHSLQIDLPPKTSPGSMLDLGLLLRKLTLQPNEGDLRVLGACPDFGAVLSA